MSLSLFSVSLSLSFSLPPLYKPHRICFIASYRDGGGPEGIPTCPTPWGPPPPPLGVIPLVIPGGSGDLRVEPRGGPGGGPGGGRIGRGPRWGGGVGGAVVGFAGRPTLGPTLRRFIEIVGGGCGACGGVGR